MFRGVDAKHQHEVLVAERAQTLPLHHDRNRPREEIVDIESDGIEPGQNPPFDLQQVASVSAVKRVLVSRLDVRALRGPGQLQTRFVSQLGQSSFDAGKITATNQQVEI